MRSLLTLGFVALAFALLVAPASASGVNLLANPGFEDLGGSYDGWFTFGAGVQLSLPAGDNIIRTGAAASKIYGEFTGCPAPSFDVGGFGQDFSPTAGKNYVLSGYTYIDSADPIPGSDICNNNRLLAKIAFFNNPVGGSEIQVNEIVIGGYNTQPDQWNHFTVSAPAPAGAMRVEALFLYLQPGCDGGAVYIDDVTFCEEDIPVEPNVLANPSFDNLLNDWAYFGNVYADARSFARRTEPAGVKMFSTFAEDSPSGLFQVFPTTPGTVWNLSGYGMTTCLDSPMEGGNDNYVALRLVFKDSGGTELQGNEFTLVDSTFPVGTWRQREVTATAPAGTDSVAAYVLFISPNLLGGAAFIDDLGLRELSPTGVGDRVQPFTLMQNAPNPFQLSTRIAFSLDTSDAVDLKVFDVQGRLVKTLLQGTLEAGPYEVVWNGTTMNGLRAADGIYRYVLTTSSGRTAKSMLLHK